MSNVRLHKFGYKQGLDALAGDEDTTSMISSAIAELAKTGGGMVAQYQASDAAKKKAVTDKKAYEAAHVEEKKATDAAQAARKAAAFAQIEAQEALDKANAVEQDPSGPLHQSAKEAAKRAALADAAARSAEAKVAFFKPTTALATVNKGSQGGRAIGSAVPSWMWWALGGIGALGVGYVGYKMMRGRK